MPNFFVPLTPISMAAVEPRRFCASLLKPAVMLGLSCAIFSISATIASFSLPRIRSVWMSSIPPDFGAVLAESSMSFAVCSNASFSACLLFIVGIFVLASFRACEWILLLLGLYKSLRLF